MSKQDKEIDKEKDKPIDGKEVTSGSEAEKKKNKEVKDEKDEKPDQVEEKKEPSAEEKLAELQDRYLRLSAEFDNYRKRTLKERMDLLKSANEELISKILPVMDDFERAIQQIDEAKDIEALKQGVHLIHNKFSGFLSQEGVKEIEALHKDFDTDIHEAVTKIPAPEKKLKGKVVDVIQKGYYLNDKVIRFSKVVIGE
jgi:molecular chaperone GrpE